MPMERLCLKWNDFESNSTNAFRELREDQEFLDVTLSSGDEQIQAHKVIISACSPFFRDVLRKNPHAHPLLYLKGVKYTYLQSLLTYMYCGEVTVAEEDLTSFLAVAEDLQVKGLTTVKSVSNTPSSPHNAPQFSDPVSAPKKSRPAPSFTPKQDNEEIQEVLKNETESLQCSGVTAAELQAQAWKQEQCQEGLKNQDQEYQDYQKCQEQLYKEQLSGKDEENIQVPVETLAVRPNNNHEELNKTIYSMMQRLEDCNFICNICGKKGNNIRNNMVRHIESNHIEGISHHCNKCDKYFTSRHSLSSHVSKKHRTI